jgi:hypothetical protein
MFNENDPLVKFKMHILEKAMPAKNAIVFGDMYIVEGGYTKKCIDYGCERALLVDTLETPAWLDLRKANPTINFYKGDFSNNFFMKGIQESFDMGVVFDILLHQAPLVNTLHLMLEKINRSICIVQPMIIEQSHPNTLIYLPGNNHTGELYPLESTDAEFKIFDVNEVNQSHWIWGMTTTFLSSILKGEGFEIVYENKLCDLPNENWFWYGCIAERKTQNNKHWSFHRTTTDIYSPSW